MTEKKLWDYDHSYYCNDSNYLQAPGHALGPYISWEDFLDAWGDAELDMNLVFRWDWRKTSYEDYAEEERDEERVPVPEAEYAPTHTLYVYFLLQRKGHFIPTETTVTEADEPAVRAWLAPRWAYLQGLWEGVADPVAPKPTDS